MNMKNRFIFIWHVYANYLTENLRTKKVTSRVETDLLSPAHPSPSQGTAAENPKNSHIPILIIWKV